LQLVAVVVRMERHLMARMFMVEMAVVVVHYAITTTDQ
jgi:hypothetical protein